MNMKELKPCTCKNNQCRYEDDMTAEALPGFACKKIVDFAFEDINSADNIIENYGVKKPTETLDMPVGARDLEVFHIDVEKKEAYIGYKIANGNFHFITVPFTGKLI